MESPTYVLDPLSYSAAPGEKEVTIVFCPVPKGSKQKGGSSLSKSPFYQGELVAYLNQEPHEAVRFSSVGVVK